MKKDIELEFLKQVIKDRGTARRIHARDKAKLDCSELFWNSASDCLETFENKCPLFKFMHRHGACPRDRAYKAALKILSKNYPIDYFEIVLKEGIK
jgi:hypothetical protein